MKSKTKFGLIGVLFSLPLIFGSFGCSSREDAVRAAENSGLKDIRVLDQSFFLNLKCSRDEMGYKITGTNVQNQRVNATVCCGYTVLKGCTIRY